ncbi:MAG TPA: HAMP domain-containing sensor histidine kinase [Terriglobia bacterium]|nr:HAMP domain-containing sensor histidine kinase [Terriglobia bacterium]
MPDPIQCDPEMMLLASLAHEISTPLGTIRSNNEDIDLAFRRVGDWMKRFPERAVEPGMKDILDVVEGSIRSTRLACERLSEIVNNVRNFARLDDAECQLADIHESIGSTLVLLAHVLKHRITVVKDYGRVRQIDCYRGQLHQVFMNIILNAAQAIEGEGEIRIKTWESDNAVHIAISDTGRGISPDVLPRIFDPGFTTKKTRLGAGLGLPICRSIVQNHNGSIEVESEAGKGSTFTIVLPVAQNSEREANG